MAKPKVFISSTFRDLEQYRKRLWNELEAIDIEILGMEKFGARASSPLDTCLEEVEKADLFVGIIAYKYGSVEPESGKSYTQLEYERAVENGADILIYLFRDNGLIQPKHIDFGENGEKLSVFKEGLMNKHTVDFFKDSADLTERVVNKIQEKLPELSINPVRPESLPAKIFRFPIGTSPWICFVSYFKGKPYEMFTGPADEEILPIPKTIKDGLVICNINSDGYERYDFQFEDRFGYRKTMEGLSYEFNKQMAKYAWIITSLFKSNAPKGAVLAAIDQMSIDELEHPDDWKNGVIQALGLK